jgi:hypothetical protein
MVTSPLHFLFISLSFSFFCCPWCVLHLTFSYFVLITIWSRCITTRLSCSSKRNNSSPFTTIRTVLKFRCKSKICNPGAPIKFNWRLGVSYFLISAFLFGVAASGFPQQTNSIKFNLYIRFTFNTPTAREF